METSPKEEGPGRVTRKYATTFGDLVIAGHQLRRVPNPEPPSKHPWRLIDTLQYTDKFGIPRLIWTWELDVRDVTK